MPGRRCGHGTGSPATVVRGTCPAQTGRAASGLSPSSGPPSETFADASSSGMERIAVALSSWRVGLADRAPAAGQHLLGERLERAQLRDERQLPRPDRRRHRVRGRPARRAVRRQTGRVASTAGPWEPARVPARLGAA